MRQDTRPSIRQALIALRDDAADDDLSSRILEQVDFALRPAGDNPQLSDAQLQHALDSGKGDPEAGRRVFYDSRTSCFQCHKVHGRGGWLGPDLTTITSAKTAEQILQSIVHPSREIAPDYQGYYALLNDGQVYKGVQFHYRGENAELQLQSGALIKFALSDTEEYGALSESLMPADLVNTMSLGELRDLLAFLSTLGSGQYNFGRD